MEYYGGSHTGSHQQARKESGTFIIDKKYSCRP